MMVRCTHPTELSSRSVGPGSDRAEATVRERGILGRGDSRRSLSDVESLTLQTLYRATGIASPVRVQIATWRHDPSGRSAIAIREVQFEMLARLFAEAHLRMIACRENFAASAGLDDSRGSP
jgi:hypothetical protein